MINYKHISFGVGDEEGRATERERDGGDSFLTTIDSVRQQHRTAFCALKNTRSSYKLAIHYVDSGLSFDSSSEVCEGEDLALAAGGGRAKITGRLHLVFVVFGCRKHRFTLSFGCVLSSCLWFFGTHSTLSDRRQVK